MELNDHHVDEVIRHSRMIRDEAGALMTELRGVAGELQHTIDLSGRMERHPWATLAVAMAAGYVLGGGLFTRFTGRLVHVGTRLLIAPLVRNHLAGMVTARPN